MTKSTILADLGGTLVLLTAIAGCLLGVPGPVVAVVMIVGVLIALAGAGRSPVSLYVGVWCAVLLLTRMAPSWSSIGAVTLLGLFFSTASFVAGSALGGLLVPAAGPGTGHAGREAECNAEKPDHWNGWMLGFWLLGFLALLRVATVSSTFGSMAWLVDWGWHIASEPQQLLVEREAGWTYLPMVMSIYLALGAALYWQHRDFKRLGVLVALACLLGVVILSYLRISRNPLIQWTMICFLEFLTLSRRAQNTRHLDRRWRVSAVAVVMLMLVVFSWSQAKLGNAGDAAWPSVLSYASDNVPNAEYWMSSPDLVRFGQRSFYLVSLAAERLGWGTAPAYVNPISPSLNAFNTLPFYAELFLDVGFLGMMVVSLLWGVAVAVAVGRARRIAASAPARVVAGLLLASVVFSFRGFVPSYWDSWVAIAILAVWMALTPPRSAVRVGRSAHMRAADVR